MLSKPSDGRSRRSGSYLPRRVGPSKILLCCCTAFALIVAVATGLVALSTYGNRIDEIRSQSQKLSSVLADHADRTFEALDVIERGALAEVMLEDDFTPDTFTAIMAEGWVHQRLRERVEGLPQVASLAIIDSKADLANFSRYWPAPKMNNADRGHFLELNRPDGPDMFISVPRRSPITGIWSITYSRRINSKRGTFLGIIVAVLEIRHFERFFASIATEPGDAISMLRDDGVLLARYPVLDQKIGQLAASNPLIRDQQKQREFSRQTSVWDGKDRLVATTRSVHYPLLINVSTDASLALMRWKRQTWFLLAAAALLEIGIAAVAIVGSKELQGRLRLAQARAEQGQLIAEAELALARERETAAEERSARDRRFRVAIETMRQGLCMFDADQSLVIFNHRAAMDLGIPFECLSPGLPMASLTALLEEYGTMDADGAARLRQSLSSCPSNLNSQTAIETLLDGRILSYAVRAMSQDTGWVLTCEDVTDRHRAEQRLLHISLHDPLTDLANRTALRNRVTTEALRAYAPDGCAILYVDLDGFKEVNDTLGHMAGDLVLQTVAERLLRSTRRGDTVARVGGDEFVVVQTSATHPETATALAERIIAELRLPYIVSGHHTELGASIGIAFIEAGQTEPDTFIKNADLALYEAKKNGGNCFCIFERRLEVAANTKSKLCAELKEAVQNQEFVVYYQPLVNVRTRTVCGFEALVRWHHPSRGLVFPGEFIESAEEIGLIGQIGEQVLLQACAQAATWPAHIKIAVNLSAKQFGQRRHISATVQEALACSGLDPKRLDLEITESILLQGNEETHEALLNLKRLGVGVSMDDFGTGYSSLSYLQRFPFDKVKIDQSFVGTMLDGGRGGPIIHAILALCKVIGLRTTAEGVETQAQFEQLEREGCDEAQGYLFGRATPADAVKDVIARLSPATPAGRPARVDRPKHAIEPA